jgi:hypothetical protein
MILNKLNNYNKNLETEKRKTSFILSILEIDKSAKKKVENKNQLTN